MRARIVGTILDVFLSVVHNAERRWYETPARGVMRIGAEAEGDVQLGGHNIAAKHVLLHFDRRVRVEVKRAYAVRIDGQLPRPDSLLELGGVLEVGRWQLRLEPNPPSGIDPIDETFIGTAEGLSGADERSVYADSLEDRGRVAEATLMRSHGADPALAVQTPPAWRRRFLRIVIENCASAVTACPRTYRPRCEVCKRDIPIIGHLASAREHALNGNPVAVDPAVRRWENDLRTPVIKRPRIEMGQPTRR